MGLKYIKELFLMKEWIPFLNYLLSYRIVKKYYT